MIPWHYRQKKQGVKKSEGGSLITAAPAPSPSISHAPVSSGTPSSVAEELLQLTQMRDQGLISQDEFELAMRKVLG